MPTSRTSSTPSRSPQRPHQPGDVHSVCEQLPTGRILHCSSVPRTIILFWQWGLQPQSQHASSHDKRADDDTNTGFHLRPLLIPLLRPAWGEGRGTCHCPCCTCCLGRLILDYVI